ncbi:unnamed protein product [marine sediment metagenome]|uniref:Uncharacterized protein n=1 Tax=marine sediment metagenome TaxID=412755 RepID=X0TFE0_9ZZZZ
MCGPADFSALSSCLTRVAVISAAGSTAYAVYKAKQLLCRRQESKKLEEQKSLSQPKLPDREDVKVGLKPA